MHAQLRGEADHFGKKVNKMAEDAVQREPVSAKFPVIGEKCRDFA
jgi:hypothetical protein